MHILYTGPISLDIITEGLPLGGVLHDTTFRFDLGARLALAFHGAGHRVTVLKLTDLVSSPMTLSCNRFELRLFPDRPVREQYRHLYHLEVMTLSKAIKAVKPDVVFANWTYQFARAAIVAGYPTLVVAHDSPWRVLWTMHDKARLLRALYSQFWVFPKVRYMTAVSPHIVHDVRRLNLYRRKVRCVPNAFFKESEDCSSRGVRVDATTIVCVTEWSALKNPKSFLRAWQVVKKNRPNTRAIVFGRGMQLDGAAGNFIRHEGIKMDDLELLGYRSRDEIDSCLSNHADLFVSTTLEESFGLIFLEAMSKGVPCVGGVHSGAVPWVIGAGEYDAGGEVCDVTKPYVVAGCILRLLDDYARRKRFSENGVNRVKNRFSLNACVKGYLDALSIVAKGGNGW